MSPRLRRTIALAAAVGGLASGSAVAFSKPYGSAPAPQVRLSCALPSHAAGSPRFGASSPGMAEYTFRGLCRGTDGRDYVSYWSTGVWTPGEADPTKANASETYRVELNQNVWQTRAPGARGDGVLTFIFGARCDRDPWLYPQAQCRAIGDNVPDDVKAAWPELASAAFPRSRQAIGDAERRQLRVAYERAHPTLRASEAARATAARTGTSSLADSRIVASRVSLQTPRIVQPEAGARAVARVRVQATTPAGMEGAAAEVALAFVPARARDAAATAAPPPVPPLTFTTTTRALATGIVLPPGATPTRPGTWTIKTRAIDRGQPGPWSDDVAFAFETASGPALQSSAARHDAAALNPQPLPPRIAAPRTQASGTPAPGAPQPPSALTR